MTPLTPDKLKLQPQLILHVPNSISVPPRSEMAYLAISKNRPISTN